jgi:flagellin-like protein
MDLKKLFQDDDAVSPVIGVILMVAITVILAAVIASFVLNLGGSQSAAPQVSFEFEYSEGASSDEFASGTADGDLTITHGSGDSVQAGRLSVTDQDGDNTLSGETVFSALAAESQVSAGTSGTVGVESDDTIRIVYTDDSGEDSTTLATWEGPDA